MLFGNTSIHDDVMLHDVELPAEFVRAFEGPRHGIEYFAPARRCSAACAHLHQRSSPRSAGMRWLRLAIALARRASIMSWIDHGLADQALLAVCGDASRRSQTALRRHGSLTRYVPSLQRLTSTACAASCGCPQRRHRHRDGGPDDRWASRISIAWCGSIRASPSWRIPRWRARASRHRCCLARSSACWAPTPSCFPTMAAASAIRRRPAATGALAALADWHGLRASVPARRAG